MSKPAKKSISCNLIRLTDIPVEVISHMCIFMDSKSLARFSITCKEANSLGACDRLWSKHFLQKWGPLKHRRIDSHIKMMKEKERKTSMNVHIMTDVQKTNENDDFSTCNGIWRSRYSREELIDLSMKQGRTSITEYYGHVGVITCLKLLSDKRILTGSDDGSMLLWSKSVKSDLKDADMAPPPALALAELALGKKRTELSSEERRSRERSELLSSLPAGSYHINSARTRGILPVAPTSANAQLCKSRTLHGHGGPVWCLSYNETTGQVYSGGYDETVKVWDLSTGNCTGTLRGHTGWVSSLVLLSNTAVSQFSCLASASWDNTLRIWRMDPDDLEGGELIRTLQAGQESGALLCVSSNGASSGSNHVSVGCCNAQIQNWDLERGIMTGSLLGHLKEVHSCQVSNNKIISGSGDGTIKLWDNNSNTNTSTFQGHNGSVMAVQYDNDFRIMSGSYDQTVKVWDIRNPSRSVVTIGGQHSAVFCLQFDDEWLVTGSADYAMRVFDWAGML